MNEKRKVIFVSGHLDLTPEEFQEHYVPRLEAAIKEHCRFVVGDAPGCDAMTQKFLFDHGTPRRLFHMLEEPRNNYSGGGALNGGFKTDEERDAAMTAASDDDIAWVRPGKRRNNGTTKNLERRRIAREAARAAEIRSWPLRMWGEREIYPHYYTADPVLEVGTNDDGSPMLMNQDDPDPDHARVPQELVDRMKAAWKEYTTCQDELERILREQGKLR